MAYLILKQGSKQAEQAGSFELNRATTTVGRKQSHDIFLTDPKVSRDHAEIVALENGGYEIHDLGARHPTRVNSQIISRKTLKDGDEIVLGDSTLVFVSRVPPGISDICNKPGADDMVEFLPEGKGPGRDREVASLDARKTTLFAPDRMMASDLASLQRDHQRLLLLYEFSEAVNSQIEDPHRMLDEVMSIAMRTLNAKRGFIAMLHEKTKELLCHLFRDEMGDQEPEKLEISSTMVYKVLRDGVSILTHNALEDGQFSDVQSVLEYRIRSAVCAPLMNRGEAIGVVYLDNRASVGSFSEDDLAFLTALCHQAGIAVGNALLHREVVQENVRLRRALESELRIVGESKGINRVLRDIKKVSPSDITVLIRGETGTGKEMVARAIHSLSPRSDGPFVPVNCAAIPKELVESELFGHKNGAFTGATSDREGKFETAHGGTIFLDEVGDMSQETQAKVLRALQEKEIEPLGGKKPVQVDVRVIAATNKDLEKAIGDGSFRSDLYYRLNAVMLELPPLRERVEDIIPLAEHFISSRVRGISPDAERLLLSYTWPGNVRELKNAIDRAVVLGDGELIRPGDLPYNISNINMNNVKHIVPWPMDSLERVEKEHIVRVLRHTNWHKSNAADILGITRQTLDNKIDRYRIPEGKGG